MAGAVPLRAWDTYVTSLVWSFQWFSACQSGGFPAVIFDAKSQCHTGLLVPTVQKNRFRVDTALLKAASSIAGIGIASHSMTYFVAIASDF